MVIVVGIFTWRQENYVSNLLHSKGYRMVPYVFSIIVMEILLTWLVLFDKVEEMVKT